MYNQSAPAPYYQPRQPQPYTPPAAYGQYDQQYAQSYGQEPFNNHINWCQGIEGAKAFPVPRGQSAQLMDSEGPYFYIKTVDPSGIPAPLRMFRYQEELQAAAPSQNPDYVTRQELPSLIAQALSAMQKDGGNDNA